VAIALVCAQSFTYTYASVSSYLGGASYVKVSLNPLDWRDPADRASFSTTARPIWRRPASFRELTRLPLYRPGPRLHCHGARAGLPRELGALRLSVLDLYSLNECRLVGRREPRGRGGARAPLVPTTCSWRS
jgi:phenylacetate-CoA ligase